MKIVFIGAGNMAEALVKGILNAGVSTNKDILVTDIALERLEYFRATYDVAGSSDNISAVKKADMVILAVKPQVLPDVLKQLKGAIRPDILLVSIVAGITTRKIEEGAGENIRVIRVMPNSPALVGAGATVFCCGRWAKDDDAKLVETLFKSVGVVFRGSEDTLDAVTALSGSGPAYVFYLIEAMLRASREMGLEYSLARPLTLATMEGALRLLAKTGLEPAQLRDKVTSKGGTTEAAIEVLRRAHVKESIVEAIRAACRRSKELSS